MFTLRKQHLEALGRSSAESFEDSLVEFLQTQAPGGEESKSEIRVAVRRQIAKARSYGLSTEREIAVYVTTAFLLGETFDQDFPAAQTVLPSKELSGRLKIEWLEQWTSEMFRVLGEAPGA